ncbi:MAG: transaldolase [Candidatus Eremiobacteraeota bacterium]|nr:transaldolase [Candidatus Eremiobacteraeota bacterium]
MTSRLAQLNDFGQSPWLDNIRRDFTRSGQLRRLIDEDGLRGETSNPTIFEKAIGGSDLYDDSIKTLIGKGVTAIQAILDALVIEDIQDACDVFSGVYKSTDRLDGYVSIELPPDLARDTQASITEGRRLWKLVDRPNCYVKVPATTQGLPVIRTLISEGINVNITLMFGHEYYERVIDAFFAGLEDRLANKQPVDHVRSVASCFVSRIDTETDKRLQELIQKTSDGALRAKAQALLGKTAIANSKRLYAVFLRSVKSERFAKLQAAGARVQRPLWASTSTKNPAYPDTYYVDALIGPDTVDTMPQATIDAFRDHGTLARTLDTGMAEAEADIAALEGLSISLQSVTDTLLDDGIVLFAKSWDELRQAVQKKVDALRSVSAASKG